MKYIRTEDGEVRTTVHLYKNEDGSYSNVNREIFGLSRIIVVKESDNLKELCDEFLCKSKTSDFWQVSPHLNWEEYDLECYNFYGAIWTNKGLIYVAKMNDKGELELL